MKIQSLALLLMASMAFVLLGCSDSNSPVTASEQALSTATSPSSLAKSGILHSATGSAHWRSIPSTGETNFRYAFSAIQHTDSRFSGEVQTRDDGPMFYGHGEVYDLKVSDNMAKVAFRFTKVIPYYAPTATVFGWFVVIDYGQGAKATGPDLASMILWTDGSDVPKTIGEIDAMEPQAYLDWMRLDILPLINVPYDQFLSPADNGSVKVR